MQSGGGGGGADCLWGRAEHGQAGTQVTQEGEQRLIWKDRRGDWGCLGSLAGCNGLSRDKLAWYLLSAASKASTRVIHSPFQGNCRWWELEELRWEGLHRLHESCAVSVAFLPTMSQFWRKRKKEPQVGGWTSGSLVQDCKDHSHTPNTELPNAGTCPVQTLAMGPNTREKRQRWGACVWHVCICVYTRVYLSTSICLIRTYLYFDENVQCKMVWKQSSWVSKEEWLNTASMPLYLPMKKTESRRGYKEFQHTLS